MTLLTAPPEARTTTRSADERLLRVLARLLERAADDIHRRRACADERAARLDAYVAQRTTGTAARQLGLLPRS